MGAEGSLEREEHISAPASQAATNQTMVAAARDELDESVNVQRLPVQVQQMIERMMNGSEPYDRELRDYECKKFNPAHINICVLRAAGFKGSEIIQITGYQRQQVYLAMGHPYGKKLVQTIINNGHGRVIDIRTRLDEYAGELIDHTFALAMQSNELKEVKEVTFGMLDRAGYGAKQSEAGGSKPADSEINADASVLKRLSRALDGSKMVDDMVMPTWTPRRPPEEQFEQDHPAAESASVGADPEGGQGLGEASSGQSGSQRARGAA